MTRVSGVLGQKLRYNNKHKKDNLMNEAFKNRVKKSLMATWKYLDADSKEEEANMTLMASTSSNANFDTIM